MANSNNSNPAQEEKKFKLSVMIPERLNIRLNLYKARRNDEDKQDIVTEALIFFLDEMEVEQV
ncbi:hypothetical protein ACSS31_29070 (plasmid) [Priestia megaterium]